MNQTPFDPNVFLSVPSQIEITEAAAKIIDVIAIGEDCLPQTLVFNTWGHHIASVQETIDEQRERLTTMGGGIFGRIFQDDHIATYDIVLPGKPRRSLICTEAESEELYMNYEEAMNRAGYKLVHFQDTAAND